VVEARPPRVGSVKVLVVEQALRLLVSTMVSSVRVEAVQEVVLADERLGDELQALEETSARAGGEGERGGRGRGRTMRRSRRLTTA